MKIPTPVAVLSIIAAVAVSVGIAYYYYQLTNPPAPVSNRPHVTEEGWSVQEIVTTLQGIHAVAKNQKPGKVRVRESETDGVYDVDSAAGRSMVDVNQGVWAPTTYTALAKALMPKPNPAAPAETNDALLERLLDPSFGVLVEAGQRLSNFLQTNPASANGHLQAALLMGTIALNDHSGKFRDIRPALNQMTAHLALADALGVSATEPARVIAGALLLTLTGNQADAVEQIASLPRSGVHGYWRFILFARNTNDPRDGESFAKTGPKAVRNEYFRALFISRSSDTGVDYLRELQAAPDANLWRIANGEPLSVELGHVFSMPMLEIELTEAATAAQKFGLPVAKDNVAWLKDYLDSPAPSILAESPEGLKIDIAGRNFFAGYHQRHLLNGLNRMFAFVNDLWGVDDQAQQIASFIRNHLPDLRYKPFLVRLIARTPQERAAANPACETIIAESPEIVTPELWASLRRDSDDNDVMGAPDFHAWFSPEVPRGTAFETPLRLYSIGVGNEEDLPWLAELQSRAPYSYELAMFNAYLENGKSHALSAPRIEKWLALQLPYSIPALTRLAYTHQDDPERFVAAMKPVLEVDPDLHRSVGYAALRHGLDDLAAEQFLLGFERAKDRVGTANDAPWLVHYLFKKGDREKARKVAEDAAEVYSYRGLESMIWLLEAEDRWEEALELSKKVDERYNDSQPTATSSCLLRLGIKDPARAQALDKGGYIQRTFPEGLRRASISDFSGPPTRGMVFMGSSSQLKDFGMKQGDVVVAISGYRVDTRHQYLAVRSLSNDPAMSLIVWDGTEYKEVNGRLPNRNFGVDIRDYKP